MKPYRDLHPITRHLIALNVVAAVLMVAGEHYGMAWTNVVTVVACWSLSSH